MVRVLLDTQAELRKRHKRALRRLEQRRLELWRIEEELELHLSSEPAEPVMEMP